ncbi:tRNA glutamyl-Q(34) synthetase GluQRS [Lichenicola sp.]|uniref:tRNA glutamyl-Q(34) synthetase GluQRS n=1 Tax=Lichenicola sp. TaxID=2804529 RepID=UPI003B0032C8
MSREPPTASQPVVTRFAPSPTGYLHLGHAWSALTAWSRAREAGGRFLLRLEDIDPGRCRPEFAAGVCEDLEWLGLHWDGPARVQSAHLDEYRQTLEQLAGRGLLYPCFCRRADIAAEIAAAGAAPHAAPDGSARYPGLCRRIDPVAARARVEAGESHALRLDMAEACRQVGGGLSRIEDGQGAIPCRPELFGDVVLARKDAPASYHLCVTHDDARAGVTLVTRGTDLGPSTDLHRLLQALMGWPAPVYAHHPLLRDESGRRFAKRDQALTLRALRHRGITPEEVLERVRVMAKLA